MSKLGRKLGTCKHCFNPCDKSFFICDSCEKEMFDDAGKEMHAPTARTGKTVIRTIIVGESPPKKKRGRPRKNKSPEQAKTAKVATVLPTASETDQLGRRPKRKSKLMIKL